MPPMPVTRSFAFFASLMRAALPSVARCGDPENVWHSVTRVARRERSFARSVDGQNRAGRRANHVLGDAPEERAREAATPVRADDDEVDVELVGELADLFVGHAVAKHGVHFDPARRALLHRGIEPGAAR